MTKVLCNIWSSITWAQIQTLTFLLLHVILPLEMICLGESNSLNNWNMQFDLLRHTCVWPMSFLHISVLYHTAWGMEWREILASKGNIHRNLVTLNKRFKFVALNITIRYTLEVFIPLSNFYGLFCFVAALHTMVNTSVKEQGLIDQRGWAGHVAYRARKLHHFWPRIWSEGEVG